MNTIEKITLYRVQDIRGSGPFKPGFSKKWVCERQDHINLPPWTLEFKEKSDKIINNDHWVGSACRTLKQLRRWFTKKEYRTLKKYGYQCYAIKVDFIFAESDIQCVYANDKCPNIDAVPIELY